MAFTRHNGTDIPDIILSREGDQVILLHKVTDRDTLVDQTRCGISIIWGTDDRAVVILSELRDCFRYDRTVTDDDALCIHLNCAKL